MREAGCVRLLRGRCISSRQFHVHAADSSVAHLETTDADRYLRRRPLRHRVAGKIPRQCIYEE